MCPGVQYHIQAPILFNAQDQEISTVGYPTDDTRATLVVSGPVANGQGHTTAVDGTCQNCSGVKLRNIQVRRDEIFSARPVLTSRFFPRGLVTDQRHARRGVADERRGKHRNGRLEREPADRIRAFVRPTQLVVSAHCGGRVHLHQCHSAEQRYRTVRV